MSKFTVAVDCELFCVKLNDFLFRERFYSDLFVGNILFK